VTEPNVFQLPQPGAFADPLTARALLSQAVEAEVAALLSCHADKVTDDEVLRNGGRRRTATAGPGLEVPERPGRRAGDHFNRGPRRGRIGSLIGNMRANGVRSLDVSCWQCHHRAIPSADPWSDDVPVRTFGPRMVCTRCGTIGAEARPNWQEQPRVRP